MPDWLALLKAYMTEVYEDDVTVALRCAVIAPELEKLVAEIATEVRVRRGEA